MHQATKKVCQRSWLLWVGAALVAWFNAFAAMLGRDIVTDIALGLTILYALCGIGFGIWAGRTIARGNRAP